MIRASGVCVSLLQRSTTAAFGPSNPQFLHVATKLLSRVVGIASRGVEAIPPALSFDMVHTELMRRLRYGRMALFGLTGYRTPAGC